MMAPTAPRTLSPEWRRIVLEVQVELLRRKSLGARSRRRAASLLRVAERLAGQIEAAEVGR